ncbi:dTDP-4-dehydrorhamnose 3,5-epimerase [Silvimonas amylolytica]|uniref:dTDP-4-dehydrorhamnose 3,5-epimerase n=1 Tax=Silvimonas amylolytica TaxID=449663 RepID=A0ABQ2PJN9_9NEIS|nr:dTDP-4-dehydrorhamnose 3,5-epimerase [Silvimonas amylolytica]GGP25446.1 dTDP-4-dehydrorhamnose 3,5-epimerase [Silvimonas amylolytica]
MQVIDTELADVKILEPKVFKDERGFFFESFNQLKFAQAIGRDVVFVQDNHSRSSKGVLRGLHYQTARPQDKLVRVLRGEVFDVVVDLRHGSPTWGRWEGHLLSEQNKRQLWIPGGFAHGFLAMSEDAEVAYKVTEYWYPEHERTLLWRDPDLAIVWPLTGQVLCSPKDELGGLFADFDVSNFSY